MASQAIEQFRAEVRRRRFRRLDDDELAIVERRFWNMHESNAIEGVTPSAEDRELFAVLLEERVPGEEWAGLVDAFERTSSRAA